MNTHIDMIPIMSEELFMHLLGNIYLLDCTNYTVWKEDCIKVLQGLMACDFVTEKEEDIRKKNVRPDAKATS